MEDKQDPRGASTTPPRCPRCRNQQTREIDMTPPSAGARWFDCRDCKHVFRVLLRSTADDRG